MQLKRRMVVFLVAVLLISNPVGSASSTSSSQNSRPRIAKKRPPQTVRDRRGDQDTLAGTRRSTAAMLWEAPGRIEELNMVYGSGGRADAPDPGGRYKFIRKLGKGYSTKYVVADDQGKKWVVKFGEEAKSETAASRIVWAMGYHTDPAYFVKSARISGVNGRKGMVALNVRFEEYRQGWKDMGHWSWEKNPFRGTRELQGLKVLMAFLNNWDLKRSNNTILCPEDGEGRCIYFVSD
ncbi:MAG TPA: hypothetical protein VEF04_17120, partial [Blastocatellia bacterium]|nr:hypothetical protein [Blastocatellia bacterium]